MTIYNWNTLSGDWNLPANWSPFGVPSLADDAIIDVRGAGTSGVITYPTYPLVTLTGTGHAATATLANNVDVQGSIGVVGDLMLEPMFITIEAGATIAAQGALRLEGGQLIVRGQLTAAAGFGITVPEPDLSNILVSGPGAQLTFPGRAEFPLGYSDVFLNGATLSAGAIVPSGAGEFAVDTSCAVYGDMFLTHRLTVLPATAGGALTLHGGLFLTGRDSDLLDVVPGAALVVTGPVSQAKNSAASTGTVTRLNIRGTAVLAGSMSTSTVGVDLGGMGGTGYPGVNQLVLAGKDAVGTGPILLSATQASLAIEAGASGGPDGRTTVIGGNGVDTVSAVDTPVLLYSGANRLTFYNGSAASTVIGGSGATTMFGGAGGGLFYGGAFGSNVIVGGAAPVTIVGGGGNDALYASATGGDLLAAASGNATLAASASTGDNVMFGGTGANIFTTGAGHDLVVAGSGTTTVFGGQGYAAVFAGAGADAIVAGGGGMYVQAGAGAVTVFAGSGADVFGAVAGQSGGTLTVAGFKTGVDSLALRGYAAAPAITSAGGSTVVTLSDNTRIVLLGVPQLGPSSFQ